MTAMQYAVLPFRRRDGVLEILMVTSRETARWVVPKGWPMAGMSPADAAAREAYEEAGITGVVGRAAISGYTYWKIIGGKRLLCTVEVFPFEVHEELAQWPERRQRKREWFSPGAAEALVDEAVLGEIIRRCDAEPGLTDLPRPRRKKRAVKAPPAKAPAKKLAKKTAKKPAKKPAKKSAQPKKAAAAKSKKAPPAKGKKSPPAKGKKAPARKGIKPPAVIVDLHPVAEAKVPAEGRKTKSRKPGKAKSNPRSRPVFAFEDVRSFEAAFEVKPASKTQPASKPKVAGKPKAAGKLKSASKADPKPKVAAKPKASGKAAEGKAKQKAGGPSRKKRAGGPKGKKKRNSRT